MKISDVHAEIKEEERQAEIEARQLARQNSARGGGGRTGPPMAAKPRQRMEIAQRGAGMGGMTGPQRRVNADLNKPAAAAPNVKLGPGAPSMRPGGAAMRPGVPSMRPGGAAMRPGGAPGPGSLRPGSGPAPGERAPVGARWVRDSH